jgi:4-hydroxybenzoate polyprenyltransferase
MESSKIQTLITKGTKGSFSDYIRALLGLSRAIIAVFVVGQAGLAAILALQGLPPFRIIIIGALACLTGSSALIGLNDLMDVDIDRKRLEHQRTVETFDLGSTFIHHPVAKGALSFRAGVIWVITLSAISMYLTYLLQPWLFPVLAVVAIFVAFYSWLGRRSSLGKIIAVACAVVIGAVAGWLAVKPPESPEEFQVFILFALWTFLWEMGGRNIPNDFGDLEEDERLGLKTIPVICGPKAASRIAFGLLIATVLAGFKFTSLFVEFADVDISQFFSIGTAMLGLIFLIWPAIDLLKNPKPDFAVRLFNKACLYPIFVLILLIANLYIPF